VRELEEQNERWRRQLKEAQPQLLQENARLREENLHLIIALAHYTQGHHMTPLSPSTLAALSSPAPLDWLRASISDVDSVAHSLMDESAIGYAIEMSRNIGQSAAVDDGLPRSEANSWPRSYSAVSAPAAFEQKGCYPKGSRLLGVDGIPLLVEELKPGSLLYGIGESAGAGQIQPVKVQSVTVLPERGESTRCAIFSEVDDVSGLQVISINGKAVLVCYRLL
jgi:hypothetical protein